MDLDPKRETLISIVKVKDRDDSMKEGRTMLCPTESN